jgi:hypothetical protein
VTLIKRALFAAAAVAAATLAGDGVARSAGSTATGGTAAGTWAPAAGRHWGVPRSAGSLRYGSREHWRDHYGHALYPPYFDDGGFPFGLATTPFDVYGAPVAPAYPAASLGHDMRPRCFLIVRLVATRVQRRHVC